MNNRLKHIVENYEKMRIGIDDSFSFHCTQCGKCCIHREDILLNAKDLYKIAKHLKLSPEQVIAQYCEVYIGDSSRLPVVRLNPRGAVHRCPFLKNQKCSIHQVKPVVCAMFPLGRAIRIQLDQQVKTEMTTSKIEYIFNHPECGDRSETQTVRDWLNMFEVPIDDEFFIRWQQTLSDVARKIHEIEPVYSSKVMSMVWNGVYTLLYLQYDTDREFDKQFELNSKVLVDIVEQLPSKEGSKYE